MARVLRWLAVLATTIMVAFVVFWLLIRLLRPGWESREYGAIALWTAPLGFLVLLVARPLRARLHSRPVVRALLGLGAAIAAAITWTFLAVALTGGYALAFDANPLWCWTTASIAGMAVDLAWSSTGGADGSQSQAAI